MYMFSELTIWYLGNQSVCSFLGMTFSVSLSISSLSVVLGQGLKPPELSLISCYDIYRGHHFSCLRLPHQAEAAAGQGLTSVGPSFLIFI